MKRVIGKRFLFLFVITIALIAVWTFSTVSAQSGDLCVCHVEKKETGEGHVIKVDKTSLKGHLRHGDVQCSIDCDEVMGKKCKLSTGADCRSGEQ